MHILIAEDELQNQKLLQRIFSRMEIETTVVEKGNDVIISQSICDLLILDLSLPDMQGIEVAKQIRNGNTVFPLNLPILLLSGKSNELMQSYCNDYAINDFIQKPFGLDDIKEKVAFLLSL
jgi:DNA-binding response OmpR family regulator